MSVAYTTPPKYAARLGCKPETVTGWIDSGELAAINVARRGSRRPRYRISPEAIAAFEAARSTVPAPKPIRRRRSSAYVPTFY